MIKTDQFFYNKSLLHSIQLAQLRQEAFQWLNYKPYMDVSKTRGIPKWMVYNGKPYEQMDDLGVPLVLETPISVHSLIVQHQ